MVQPLTADTRRAESMFAGVSPMRYRKAVRTLTKACADAFVTTEAAEA